MTLTLDLFAEPVDEKPEPAAEVVHPAPAPPPEVRLMVLDRRAEASALAQRLIRQGERTCAALRFFWAWKAAGRDAFAFSLDDHILTEASRAANELLRGVASDRPYVCAARFAQARAVLETQGASA